MPFIHVKSLPFEPPLATGPVLEALCRDFAAGTGIAPGHITATWEFFAPGHYAVAGVVASVQPASSHPVLVDLLAPDFIDPAVIENSLHAIAGSLSAHAGVPVNNIFINHRQAGSGRVFDAGRVVRW